MAKEEYLTAEQAAQELGVSVATIYTLVRRGKLRKQQRLVGFGFGGRRTYFLRSEIEALQGYAAQPRSDSKRRKNE